MSDTDRELDGWTRALIELAAMEGAWLASVEGEKSFHAIGHRVADKIERAIEESGNPGLLFLSWATDPERR